MLFILSLQIGSEFERIEQRGLPGREGYEEIEGNSLSDSEGLHCQRNSFVHHENMTQKTFLEWCPIFKVHYLNIEMEEHTDDRFPNFRVTNLKIF